MTHTHISYLELRFCKQIMTKYEDQDPCGLQAGQNLCFLQKGHCWTISSRQHSTFFLLVSFFRENKT